LPKLALHEVSKRFGGVLANDRVTLHVNEREVVGLIGPNGSGKTTLFGSIVGNHALDGGAISYEGRDITGLSVQVTARLGILRTFQQSRIYREMTILDNVRISLPARHMTWSHMLAVLPADVDLRARQVLDLVGLHEPDDRLAGQLSFGQQRLLEIAMVLMNEPRLLLLDEPTAGVNPAAIDALINCLRRVRDELDITLLVIEHNMPVIMGLADRIYCLSRGQVLAEGEPAMVRKDQRVVEAYLGAQ
jgi:branched-chain amino acid transport system ATP-binding protein